MTKKFFFWPLLVFLALVALQALPFPGIYLTMLGGPWLAGLALVLTVAGLALDALVGNILRVWLIIPSASLLVNYILYYDQGLAIAKREAELKGSNPTQLLQFDPSRHSLVTKAARAIVTGYQVPVAFSRKINFKPQNYASHQLISRQECRTLLKDRPERVLTSGVNFQPPAGRRVAVRNLCVLSFPERPSNEIVEVLIKDQEIWKRKPTIMEGVYTLKYRGKTLGEYRTGSIYRYFALPFPLIGCGLNSSGPRWECFATLKKSLYTLDTKPDAVTEEGYTNPIAIMLGLKRYTLKSLEGFQGYASNKATEVKTRFAAAGAKARDQAARVEDKTFNLLDQMLRDPKRQKWEMPPNFVSLLVKNKKRLAAEVK